MEDPNALTWRPLSIRGRGSHHGFRPYVIRTTSTWQRRLWASPRGPPRLPPASPSPTGSAIPQPISADAPYQTSAGSLTLQSLFASRNEQIDWQLDASTTPAVFSPLCGFTGTLVLRGGDATGSSGTTDVTGAGGAGGSGPGKKPLPAEPGCNCSLGDEAPSDLAAAATGLLLLAVTRRRARRGEKQSPRG